VRSTAFMLYLLRCGMLTHAVTAILIYSI